MSDLSAVGDAASPSTNFLNNITLELPLPILQFEDGDVIILLERAAKLVVHSSVLSAASPRLKIGLARWSRPSHARHPTSGQLVPVYTYLLTHAELTYCLTDENESTDDEVPEHCRDFHQSALATGFTRHFNFHSDFEEARQESVVEHKILFALLYKIEIELEADDMRTTMARISNIIALAEYYEFLPAVAPQTSKLLKDLPDIWKWVAAAPAAFIAIANKLRDFELFADAVRHFAGRDDSDMYDLQLAGLTLAEIAAAVLPAQHTLNRNVDSLQKELRRLSLTPYQAHANLSRRKQGPVVRTTWLNASFGRKSLQQKSRFLATSIFREWMDQQLYGEPHWSHVKYSTTNPKSGEVQAGSLRRLCDTITITVEESKPKCGIFGHNVPGTLAANFALYNQQGPHPASILAQELRRLVVAASRIIASPSRSLSLGDFIAAGSDLKMKSAKHDKGLDYFTYTLVQEEYMPWSGKTAWDDFELKLTPMWASADWLRALGLKRR